MRKVSTSFICLSLGTLGTVDRKQEMWRVGEINEKYVIQAVILLFGNK